MPEEIIKVLPSAEPEKFVPTDEKYYEDIKNQKQEEWNRLIEERKEKIWKEWWNENRKKYKGVNERDIKRGTSVRFLPSSDVKTTGDTPPPLVNQPTPNPKATGKLYDYNPEREKAIKSFREYFLNKEKERWAFLNDQQKSLEITMGGIENENFQGNAIAAGFIERASLETLNQDHPIYGDFYKQFYKNEYAAGSIVGELAGFMGVSSVLKSLKVPIGIAKLAEKSDTARRLIEITGQLPNLANKEKVLTNAVNYLSRRFGEMTLAQIGAEAITTGIAGSIQAAAKEAAERYYAEDKMSKSEYKKYLKEQRPSYFETVTKGFFDKYFLHTINAPEGWPLRFLGDAVYSLGQQGYNILLGRQESFDTTMFWKDWVLGNLMGEAFDVLFKPTREQMKIALANKAQKQIMDNLINLGYAKTHEDTFFTSEHLLNSVLQYQYKHGMPPPPERFKVMFNDAGQKLKNGFDVILGSKFNDLTVIKPEHFTEAINRQYDTAYNQVNLKYNINTKKIRDKKIIETNNVSAFIDELKKEGVFDVVDYTNTSLRNIEKVRDNIENLPKISEETFLKELGERIEKYVPELFPKQFKSVQEKINFLENNLLKIDETPTKTYDNPDLEEPDKRLWTDLTKEEQQAILKGKTKYKNVKIFGYKDEDLARMSQRQMAREYRQNTTEEYINNQKKEVDDALIQSIINRSEDKGASWYYSVLLKNAKNRKGVLKVISNYLRYGEVPRADIVNRLEQGIFKIRSKDKNKIVTDWNTDINNSLKEHIGLKDSAEITKLKIDDAKSFFKQLRKNVTKTNQVTGIETDIDIKARKLMNANGACIIKLKPYQRLITGFNENVANRVVYKWANIIKNLINESNINTRGTIYLKNPETDTIVLYQKGLSKDEFQDTLRYIGNVLRRNFSSEVDYARKFAIRIKKTDDELGDIITNFDVGIKQITDVTDTIGTPVELSDTLSPWKQVQISQKENVIDINKEFNTPKEILEVNTKQAITEPSQTGIIADRVIKDNDIASTFGQAFSKVKTVPTKIQTLLNKHTIPFVTNAHKWLVEKLDVLEGQWLEESMQPAIQKVYELGVMTEITANEVTSFMKNDIKTITSLREGITAEQFEKIQMPLIPMLEMDTFKIFDKRSWEKTGYMNTHISPNVLKDKIEWKGSEKINLANYRNKTLTVNDIVNLRARANDNELFYAKFISQVYDIPPEKLFDFMKNYAEEILYEFDKLQTRHMGLTMADVYGGDVFKKQKLDMKKKLLDKFIEQLGKDVSAFIDDKKQLIQIVNTTKTDPVITKGLLTFIEEYFNVDPHKMMYVHHLVLGKSKEGKANIERMYSEILQLAEGKNLRGKDAITPAMRSLRGRKFVDLESLIANKYVVSNTGFTEMIHSQLTYMNTKVLNADIFKQMKTNFMKGFLDAYANDTLSNFLQAHTGYFYKPTAHEYNTLKQTADKIDDFISKQPADSTDKINYIIKMKQYMSTEIKERLELMKRVMDIMDNETFSGQVTNMTAGEQYVSMHKDSYFEDTKMIPALKRSIVAQIKRHNINAYNIAGAEGLYLNRLTWRAMKQFVLRDAIAYNSPDEFVNSASKQYDNISRVLKTITLIKPQIMMANDMAQAGMANPFFFRKLPEAFRIFQNRGDRHGADGKMYELALKNNLFNMGIYTPKLYSDAFDAQMDIINSTGTGKLIKKMQNDIIAAGSNAGKISSVIRNLYRADQGLTWNIDAILRLALFKTQYDMMLPHYQNNPDKTAYHAALYVNEKMAHYDRIPHATRRAWNRVGGFLTYRYSMLRMYFKTLTDAGTGIARVFGANIDPRFKVSDDRFRQAWFEIQPVVTNIAGNLGLKAVISGLFGYNFGEDIWDKMTGYRGSKTEGNPVSNAIEFLSLGTPFFEVQKYLTRPMRVTLRYNANRFIGLTWSLLTNEDFITYKPIWTSKNPFIAGAQIGANLLKNYFPLGSDFTMWAQEDLTLFQNLINFSGISYMYNTKSPKEMISDFKIASNKSLDTRDRIKVEQKFWKDLNKVYNRLYGTNYLTLMDQLKLLEDNAKT